MEGQKREKEWNETSWLFVTITGEEVSNRLVGWLVG